jgi:hypothetical protein
MIEKSSGPGITYPSQIYADTVQEFQDCISSGGGDHALSTSLLPILDLKHCSFTTQLRPLTNRICQFENELNVVHPSECDIECLN